jgi:hypothetical protein
MRTLHGRFLLFPFRVPPKLKTKRDYRDVKPPFPLLFYKLFNALNTLVALLFKYWGKSTDANMITDNILPAYNTLIII